MSQSNKQWACPKCTFLQENINTCCEMCSTPNPYVVEQKDDDLYHEKQQLQLCLLHAINSLLQENIFTQKMLNNICKELSPNKLINPHKSFFQTGNYDVNVLIKVLQKIDIQVQWFDARKVNELDLNNNQLLEPQKSIKFIGFILNNPQKAMMKLFSRRHWITIRKVDDFWYNFDSKLKEPYKFKDGKEASSFIQNAMKTNNAELMICRTCVQLPSEKE